MADTHAPTRSRSAARRLAAARLVSVFGSSATNVALSWYIWERTQSSAWVAAAFLTGSLVMGIASMPAGALADRFDRRRLMVTSDIAGGAVFIVLTIGVVLDAPPLLLIALMGLAALCESPFMAASMSAIPNLVDDADVPWANAMLARIQTIVTVIAPAAGGAIAAAAGAGSVLMVNAASFVVSATLIASIRVPMSERERAAHDGAPQAQPERRPRGEAVRFAWRTPLLRATVFPGFIAFIGVGFSAVANPQLAELLELGALGLGLLWGATSAGAFVATFFVSRLLVHGREFRVSVIGFALHGIGLALVAFVPELWSALVGLGLLGIGIGITAPARQTIVQRSTPDDLRGATFGLMEAVGWVSFALSGVLAGVFVDIVGLQWSYGIAALLFFAGVALQLVLRIDRQPPAREV